MTEVVEVVTGHPPLEALSLPPGNAGGVVVTAPRHLAGWALYEPTGAAAAMCAIYDGSGNTGQRLAVVTLTAGQSVRDYVPHGGLYVCRGLAVVVTSGQVDGELWVVLR